MEDEEHLRRKRKKKKKKKEKKRGGGGGGATVSTKRCLVPREHNDPTPILKDLAGLCTSVPTSSSQKLSLVTVFLTPIKTLSVS